MSKKLFFVFLFFVAVISVYLISQPATLNYTLEGKKYRLRVAKTAAEWQRGLMSYQKPVTNFDGMIFIFPKKEIQTFWNKNTFLDLDVYWLNNDQIVGRAFLPSVAKSGVVVQVVSPEAVNRVIEIIK